MRDTHATIHTWRTRLTLAVHADPTRSLQQWLASTLATQVADLDKRASRFREDSEVSSLNRCPGQWVETSWEFVEVLTASLEAAAATDGLVSPLLGRHVVAAGYDTWAGQASLIHGPAQPASWQDVEIKPGSCAAAVRIPPDSALDLGAVAKGWLADRLAKTVHQATGLDVLANMGGDMRIISPAEPWIVGADPEVPAIEPCDFELEDAGIATSGVGHRVWDGGHHIIDPRTGKSAVTPWFSVTALAAEAAGANAASTAGVILGDAGPTWFSEIGLDGWFVGWDGHTAHEVAVGAWRELRPTATA